MSTDSAKRSRMPHGAPVFAQNGKSFQRARRQSAELGVYHDYPNYYHHRNPRSPYDIDRSPVWYVQKLCHHYCEPANHPPRFALSLHGVRRAGRFNAFLSRVAKKERERRKKDARAPHSMLSTLLYELSSTRDSPQSDFLIPKQAKGQA